MTDIKQAKMLVLGEYERERDELNLLISRLRRELGLEASNTSPEPELMISQSSNGVSPQKKVEDLVKPGDFYKMTQIGAARDFLERRGEKNTATLQEISHALLRGKAIDAALDDKGLRNLSSMMSKHDDFTSVAKGRWGLAKWYGGKDRKSKKQDDEAGGDKQETPEDKKETASE